MSDIFISYASEDKGRVQALAHALERKGWSVWWDRRIPIGRSFDEVIEEALDGSKAVVVVWTGTSVKSQWVKNEAREGLRRRVLFPVMLLEEIKLPLDFRHVQTAHLMDWQPEQEHAGFDQFIHDLASLIGAPVHAEAQPKLEGMGTTSAEPTMSQSTTGIKAGAESRSTSEPAKQIIGKDGAPMVLIPAGEFWMGSVDGEGDEDEHPRHGVALSAFYLDKYEVTNRLFQQFIQQTGYRTTAEREGSAWAFVEGKGWEETTGATGRSRRLVPRSSILAERSIPWCVSPGTMRRPIAGGPESGFPRKQSLNTRHELEQRLNTGGVTGIRGSDVLPISPTNQRSILCRTS